MTAGNPVKDQQVQMDRRRQERRHADGPQIDSPTAGSTQGAPARRKKQRRRQIDPTTCERDYSQDEIEFMRALDAYKRSSGRMFPTCSEILEVVRSIGYVRLTEEEREVIESLKQLDDTLPTGDAGHDEVALTDDTASSADETTDL
ncbi:MAG: hypothetical protein KatS3mg111_2058 [Pirellulaceae bacterium]|nr:MAG: hypothetical protein KatS3mg111_2058 [Pirellulaceae bacterium]